MILLHFPMFPWITVTAWLLEVVVFDPENYSITFYNLAELLDAVLILMMILQTMAEFAMQLFWSKEETDLSLLRLECFFLRKMETMHNLKRFSMTVEENLLHRFMVLDGRSYTSDIGALYVCKCIVLADLPLLNVFFANFTAMSSNTCFLFFW